ncbi:MAG: indolepyruvate oxidoreductase subunit beta [Caldiserica bacterium]|jgi:indolepyruvate ferredoxin oxidoreductase beta subunit|nr:indolepyruvate oxidoreductase subunit beta [Caldisericota bacterium]MDH7562355.1 indolepyruvate oxidoreductase subunit beta [Caldisericota bacterium]
MNSINFLICGVGGQGTVVASDIVSEVGLKAGFHVKKSDVLGLAVRGGSVISHIRWGRDEIHAPMVGQKEVDLMLAFEPLEGLRRLNFMKDSGKIILNTQKIPPISVNTGREEYPSMEKILGTLRRGVAQVFPVDALAKALELGNSKVVNIVLIGVLSTFFTIDSQHWKDSVKKFVAPKFLEVNLKAFEAGREIGASL